MDLINFLLLAGDQLPSSLALGWISRHRLRAYKGQAATFTSAGAISDGAGGTVAAGVLPLQPLPGSNGLVVVWGGPAYSNLIVNVSPTTESVTLTAQKYCLRVFGAGASCIAGINGTATVGTELVFTPLAAPCVFTPTNCTSWSLTAVGGYVFPYIPPGQSSASAAGTAAPNGLSWLMNARVKAALDTGGRCTVVSLDMMGAGSSELPTTQYNISILSSVDNSSKYNPIGYFKDSNSTYFVFSGDGTSYANAGFGTWNRYSLILRAVQTKSNGTQFRVGYQRFTSAMVPIDSNPVWSSWVNYDGSFNPLTYLRAFFNNTIPIWKLGTWVFDKGATEVADAVIKREVQRVRAY